MSGEHQFRVSGASGAELNMNREYSIESNMISFKNPPGGEDARVLGRLRDFNDHIETSGLGHYSFEQVFLHARPDQSVNVNLSKDSGYS
jgi:hypothetical protein